MRTNKKQMTPLVVFASSSVGAIASHSVIHIAKQIPHVSAYIFFILGAILLYGSFYFLSMALLNKQYRFTLGLPAVFGYFLYWTLYLVL